MLIQLTNGKRPGESIFIDEEVKGPTRLVFRCDHVRFDSVEESNVRIKTEAIHAYEFTGWWLVKMCEGWRIFQL